MCLQIDLLLINNEDGTYAFTISDKVQPKVTVEMKASVARVVMAMFSYYLCRRIGKQAPAAWPLTLIVWPLKL